MRNKPLFVFVLPSSNKNNTYIDLLITSLEKQSGIKVVRTKRDNLWGVLLFTLRGGTRGGRGIVHVQWSTVLYGSRFLVKSVFLMGWNGLLLLILKLILGFRVVWTVHNFYAHDYPYPTIDSIGRNLLRHLSDSIIVHETSVLENYKKQYGNKDIQYVPHGNYIGVYGPQMEVDSVLRESFGFTASDVVLVSIGTIAPYKVNDKIIDAVQVVQKVRPHLKLLIAGRGNPTYVESLHKRIEGHGIRIVNNFIPNNELPNYLSIADYSIFYYDESEMTSGGIVLSLSYGVPVITRNIPSSELVHGEQGFVFEDQDKLVKILQNLTAGRSLEMTRGIIQSISKNSWSVSAQRLAEIYGKLG